MRPCPLDFFSGVAPAHRPCLPPSPLYPSLLQCAVSLLLLGLAGFSNSLALFWLLLVVTLQRGPVRARCPVAAPRAAL